MNKKITTALIALSLGLTACGSGAAPGTQETVIDGQTVTQPAGVPQDTAELEAEHQRILDAAEGVEEYNAEVERWNSTYFPN
jgi:hypothetical protein